MGRVQYLPANLKRGLLTTSSIQTSFRLDRRSLGMLHIILIMSWANSFLSRTLSLIMSGITPGKNFRAAPYNSKVMSCRCCTWDQWKCHINTHPCILSHLCWCMAKRIWRWSQTNHLARLYHHHSFTTKNFCHFCSTLAASTEWYHMSNSW